MQEKTLIVVTTACLVCIATPDGLSFHGLSASLLTAFVVLLPASLLPRCWQTTAYVLLGVMFICLCLVDCFCQLMQHTPLSPQILATILQTDRREATEYLTTFVSPDLLTDGRIATLFILFVLLFIPLRWRLPRPFVILLLPIFFIVELPSIRQCSRLFHQGSDIRQTENLIFQRHMAELSTPLHRLLFAAYSHVQTSRQLKAIKDATLSADIDACSHLSPHIVLVIGESNNKHHASLYGYKLSTTPLQQQRQKAGELIVFSNVVTPWNITSNVFFDLFSLWENGMATSPTELPMFPVLFRRAGYEVNFTSNQYRLRGLRKGETNQAGNFFLADQVLSDTLFTHRIPHGASYDMEFLRRFANHKARWGEPDYTLDIIHLIGQHFNYARRYPPQHAVFTPSDYAHRSLNYQEKQTVAHYDNATRYNDIVLDSIITLYEHEEAIIVFVSDHGEEVYDEIPVEGRLFQEPTAPIARQEYEVPMWIWCSDTYREKHPNLVNQMKAAKDKSFMTDALPQLLLYLAGIHCQWYCEQRNLLSPNYKSKPRFIGGTVDYDRITGNEASPALHAIHTAYRCQAVSPSMLLNVSLSTRRPRRVRTAGK